VLTRDIFIVAVTATVSSFLTYLAVDRGVHSGSAATEPPSQTETAKEEPGERLNPNEKAILAKIGDNTATTTNLPRHEEKKNEETEQRIEREVYLRLKKQNELRKKFAGFFDKKLNMDPGRLNAEIENRFYTEEWDQEWARDKESNILNLFKTNANLNNIPPLNVACRSKNCQVVLAASDQEQIRDLSRKFMEIAASSDIGMKDKSISFFPDISAGRLVFYLSENGNMDLFQ
jgi:hypothetical protein